MLLGIPIVLFTTDVFEPRIQGIVDHETVSQLLVVVREVLGQPKRNREQARALGCEIESSGVGPAHNHREIEQAGIGQFLRIASKLHSGPS